jgi:hypothetical protein
MRSLIEDEVLEDKIELPSSGMGLDLLRAVYRNPHLSLHIRMRAAIATLPFESPKLIAQAILNEGSFAELLERRLKRMEQAKLIPQAKPPQIETKPSLSHTVDRRYRRI